MSSCHREDQGERPPGVRNALLFSCCFPECGDQFNSILITPCSELGVGVGGGDAENRKRMGHSLTRPNWDATNKIKGEEKRW